VLATHIGVTPILRFLKAFAAYAFRAAPRELTKWRISGGFCGVAAGGQFGADVCGCPSGADETALLATNLFGQNTSLIANG